MRLITLLILIGFSTSVAQGQTAKKKSKKNYYILINDTSFVNAMPENGAELRAYFVNDTLSKITTWFGFNFGDVTRDYFYWEDTLSLVNETQKLYNATAVPKINPDSIKISYSGRYIFRGGKLMEISQKGNYSISDTPATKNETEAVLLSLSEKYRKLVYEKRKKKKNRIHEDS